MCGWDGVRWDNPVIAWGHQVPLVVGQVWKKVTVKLEVRDAATVGSVVKAGVVVGDRQFGTQLAVSACGRGVQEGSGSQREGAPVNKPAAVVVVCYGCGGAGHLRRDCRAGWVSNSGGRPPFLS